MAAVRVLNTVLYDEDEFALNTFRFVLEQANFNVLATAKSGAVIELLEIQRPDVVITAVGPKHDLARSLLGRREVLDTRAFRVLLTPGSTADKGGFGLRTPPPHLVIPKTEALKSLPATIREKMAPKRSEDATELRERARKIIRAVARVGHENGEHCERLAHWSRRFGAMLGLPPEKLLDLELGALLHDVGQLDLGDAALLRNGPLTDREQALMREHPRLGADLLREIPQLRRAIPVVYNHHERFDGSGYPRGIARDAIPYEARVFAVVDGYEALVMGRPWRGSGNLVR